MCNGLGRGWCCWVVGHGRITRLAVWRTRRWSRSGGWSREGLGAADTGAATRLRYSGALQPCNDWAQGIVLVLRMRGRGIWIGHDLELVWLHDSAQRVVEESGILGGPEVYVEGVQPVHVLGLVGGVMRREVPLRGILLGTLCRTGALAAEPIDRQSEEAGVLVRVLYSDRLKLYATNNVSSLLHIHNGWVDIRPAKASWSGVPAWFAISMRPVCRMGLW
jgi:hypothetical protein